jgi:hypothetical protein
MSPEQFYKLLEFSALIWKSMNRNQGTQLVEILQLFLMLCLVQLCDFWLEGGLLTLSAFMESLSIPVNES